MSNASLNTAKRVKNDEFYTRYEDVEKELCHYTEHFRDKVVYCNCDNPEWSAFWQYFHENFAALGLRRLVATFYDPAAPVYKMVYEGSNDTAIVAGVKTPLAGNGDFRNEECLTILDEADIVVTNPPFSLALDYLRALVSRKKPFLIVGDLNWITNKDIFPLVKANKMCSGYSGIHRFYSPQSEIKKFGNKLWLTNLAVQTSRVCVDTGCFYYGEDGKPKQGAADKYRKYDTYDAINVPRSTDIPMDYLPCWFSCANASGCNYAKEEGMCSPLPGCERAVNGIMAVPISFFDKLNPAQFELVGEFNHGQDNPYDLAKPCIDGKELFPRLAIRWKR